MDIAFLTVLWQSLVGQMYPQGAQNQPQAPIEEKIEPQYTVLRRYIGEVTGYSSREEETDDTPHITASGSLVHWGIVATNAYPFGTKMRFPDIYGDRIFTVTDRMNARYKNRVDLWFPEYEQARRFGLQATTIEIVQDAKDDELAQR